MTTTTAAETSERPRAGRGTRRFGYVVAVAVNLVMLLLIHTWPGWDAVPFLSGRMTDVLPYVDASIAATILVNALYLARDSRAVKAIGDLAANVVSFVVLIRFWQVWPFDFDGVWGGWQPLTYVLLVVATFGMVIAALVQVTTLIRLALDRR